ncbi:hypothetical protein [Streptomyces cavernae]|uniref:hypothetical protein n=1 Tax=Streptomyces cavernae TaxID=2259034 RepID=UPI001EE3E920|nr:hypothetical protein [Streptomyces cavernae]
MGVSDRMPENGNEERAESAPGGDRLDLTKGPAPKPSDTPEPTAAAPVPATPPQPTDAIPSPTDTTPEPTDAIPSPTDTTPEPTDAIPSPTDAVPSAEDTAPPALAVPAPAPSAAPETAPRPEQETAPNPAPAETAPNPAPAETAPNPAPATTQETAPDPAQSTAPDPAQKTPPDPAATQPPAPDNAPNSAPDSAPDNAPALAPAAPRTDPVTTTLALGTPPPSPSHSPSAPPLSPSPPPAPGFGTLPAPQPPAPGFGAPAPTPPPTAAPGPAPATATSYYLPPPAPPAPTAPLLFPPPPSRPPTVGTPADPLRALAAGLLNLSGLGIGYALLRRWAEAAVCWAATAVLLLVALPADVDGVPRGALIGYLVLLVLAAVDGARRGLRTPLARPSRAPLALALGLALLLVPAAGTVAYDGARDEAIEQMLLDRLTDTDELVEAQEGKPFSAAEDEYKTALARYDDLVEDHPGSRAAGLVPERLETFYETVAAPYDAKDYCGSVEPLTYLRTLPDTVGEDRLGELAAWPDDRLATSLLECGTGRLGTGDEGGMLGQLLSTFPDSGQAAKVEPALTAAIDTRVKALGGAEPCAATDELRAIGETADNLPGDVSARITGRTGKAVESGTYACGVDQFKDGDFAEARKTLTEFADTYKNDRNRSRAQKIAIAAEIAEDRPAAGRRLPSNGTRAAPGWT